MKEADIVIAAVGKPELVRGDWLKPGAVVIDVGINAVDVSSPPTQPLFSFHCCRHNREPHEESQQSPDQCLAAFAQDPSTKKGYRLVGDVCYAEAKQVASLITPVPGGVGPMTIAMLLSNTLDAAKRSFGV